MFGSPTKWLPTLFIAGLSYACVSDEPAETPARHATAAQGEAQMKAEASVADVAALQGRHERELHSALAVAYKSAPPPVLPIVRVVLRENGGKTVADVYFNKDNHRTPGTYRDKLTDSAGKTRTSWLQFADKPKILLNAGQIALINAAPDGTDVGLMNIVVDGIEHTAKDLKVRSNVVFDFYKLGVIIEDIEGRLEFKHD